MTHACDADVGTWQGESQGLMVHFGTTCAIKHEQQEVQLSGCCCTGSCTLVKHHVCHAFHALPLSQYPCHQLSACYTIGSCHRPSEACNTAPIVYHLAQCTAMCCTVCVHRQLRSAIAFVSGWAYSCHALDGQDMTTWSYVGFLVLSLTILVM